MGAEQSVSRIISSIAVVDDLIYVGTVDGIIAAFPAKVSGPPGAPSAQLSVKIGKPISQLQVLPAIGLLLRECDGQVSAHAERSLRLVADLHPSRATRFHGHSNGPVTTLCVCAGRSLLWKYALSVPPKLHWSRMLEERTLAVHLTREHVVVATTCSCLVLSSSSGATMAECFMPHLTTIPASVQQPNGIVKWTAARLVPTSDSSRLQAPPSGHCLVCCIDCLIW